MPGGRSRITDGYGIPNKVRRIAGGGGGPMSQAPRGRPTGYPNGPRKFSPGPVPGPPIPGYNPMGNRPILRDPYPEPYYRAPVPQRGYDRYASSASLASGYGSQMPPPPPQPGRYMDMGGRDVRNTSQDLLERRLAAARREHQLGYQQRQMPYVPRDSFAAPQVPPRVPAAMRVRPAPQPRLGQGPFDRPGDSRGPMGPPRESARQRLGPTNTSPPKTIKNRLGTAGAAAQEKGNLRYNEDLISIHVAVQIKCDKLEGQPCKKRTSLESREAIHKRVNAFNDNVTVVELDHLNQNLSKERQDVEGQSNTASDNLDKLNKWFQYSAFNKNFLNLTFDSPQQPNGGIDANFLGKLESRIGATELKYCVPKAFSDIGYEEFGVELFVICQDKTTLTFYGKGVSAVEAMVCACQNALDFLSRRESSINISHSAQPVDSAVKLYGELESLTSEAFSVDSEELDGFFQVRVKVGEREFTCDRETLADCCEDLHAQITREISRKTLFTDAAVQVLDCVQLKEKYC